MRALRVSNKQSKESLQKIIAVHRRNGVNKTEIRRYKDEYAIYLRRDTIK